MYAPGRRPGFSFSERHSEFPQISISLSKLDSHAKIHFWVSSGHLSVAQWLACNEIEVFILLCVLSIGLRG
jgi:hypothetical protein